MSDWSKQRLEQMIADGIEESPSLDYKRAAALSKSDERKKIEVTKDVSSFANSGGGVLVYGVAEYEDEPRKHRPERLDPIKRVEISKEWLDQIIQSIQPRIEGVAIYPVTISEVDCTVCYVVEVPQSHTAHMARDHRYHKRHNFTTAPMEDYEVRDVMSRRKHPRLDADVWVNHNRRAVLDDDGVILVRVKNTGRVLVNYLMVELEVPVHLNHPIHIDESPLKHDVDGDYFLARLTPQVLGTPVFPGSYQTLRLKYRTRIKHVHPEPQKSRSYLRLSVFADAMAPLRAKLDIPQLLKGWTPLAQPEAHA